MMLLIVCSATVWRLSTCRTTFQASGFHGMNSVLPCRSVDQTANEPSSSFSLFPIHRTLMVCVLMTGVSMFSGKHVCDMAQSLRLLFGFRRWGYSFADRCITIQSQHSQARTSPLNHDGRGNGRSGLSSRCQCMLGHTHATMRDPSDAHCTDDAVLFDVAVLGYVRETSDWSSWTLAATYSSGCLPSAQSH